MILDTLWKILFFQKSSLFFSPPSPRVWQKTILFPNYFFEPFPKNNTWSEAIENPNSGFNPLSDISQKNCWLEEHDPQSKSPLLLFPDPHLMSDIRAGFRLISSTYSEHISTKSKQSSFFSSHFPHFGALPFSQRRNVLHDIFLSMKKARFSVFSLHCPLSFQVSPFFFLFLFNPLDNSSERIH